MHIRSLLIPALAAISNFTMGQFAVNPQLGVNFTRLTNTPAGVTSSAAAGFQLGADLRLGDRLYFQPGAFFGRSATYVKLSPQDTVTMEDNLIRTTAKVKALMGYNLVHGDAFRLRVNAGPTYEALLSVDNKDDQIAFNKDDYNGGSFNLDAGLGLDLVFITLEGGLSYGLSNAYKDEGKLLSASKYFTWYATLGFVIGGGRN
ncbi:MAG: outer membrane beta-barrel protein [Flavobacteriales bacterium]|nr:outer membrane beta-barrel protein [Flavobacteriales bacterium]MBP9079782.1 outer membrane beta-barrel protein [Flavobacteriales bacterium]